MVCHPSNPERQGGVLAAYCRGCAAFKGPQLGPRDPQSGGDTPKKWTAPDLPIIHSRDSRASHAVGPSTNSIHQP
jgi:hypothetical protein